jgi:hypothetical protein
MFCPGRNFSGRTFGFAANTADVFNLNFDAMPLIVSPC